MATASGISGKGVFRAGQKARLQYVAAVCQRATTDGGGRKARSDEPTSELQSLLPPSFPHRASSESGHGGGEIGIVDGLRPAGAEIEHAAAQRRQFGLQDLLQVKAGMVRSNGDGVWHLGQRGIPGRSKS